ncbi:TolC family protein [Pedobacter sp. NJ-S-72]
MKQQKIIISYSVFCISFLFLSSSSLGQSIDHKPLVITLNEAWGRASAYNKEVAAQRITVKQESEQLNDAKVKRLPSVQLGTSYSRFTSMTAFEDGLSKSKNIHITPDQVNLGADASMELYNGHQINNGIKEKEQTKILSVVQQSQQLADIKLKVASAYYSVQRNEQFKNLLLANLKEEQKRQMQMKILFKNGVVLRSDLLRAELQISRQNMKLIEVNNTILLVGNELKLLLGLSPEQEIQLSDLIVKPLLSSDQNLATLISGAQNNAYEIKIAAQKEHIALFRQKQVQAAFLPKIELLASYGYNYPDNLFYRQ